LGLFRDGIVVGLIRIFSGGGGGGDGIERKKLDLDSGG